MYKLFFIIFLIHGAETNAQNTASTSSDLQQSSASKTVRKGSAGVALWVNHTPIFQKDVSDRIRLLFGEEMVWKAEMRAKVLTMLKEEFILMQAAKDAGVSVSGEDVRAEEKALLDGFSPEDKKRILKPALGKTWTRFLLARLMWARYLEAFRAGAGTVSKVELAAETAKHKAFLQTERVELSEIVLPFRNAEEKKICIQITHAIAQGFESGRTFSECARRFSKSLSAENGGHLGWISVSDAPDLKPMLNKTPTGKVSGPWPMSNAFVFLFVHDRKAAEAPDALDRESQKAARAALASQNLAATSTYWKQFFLKRAVIS